MKRLGFLLGLIGIALFAGSCDLDDDSSNFHFETLEITQVDMPEEFEFGQIYRIGVTYNRPTTCHFFEGFDYSYDAQTERTIVAVGSVIENNNCEELVGINPETSFDFEVRYREPYTFHFYSGEDQNGEPQYITIEVPVIDVTP